MSSPHTSMTCVELHSRHTDNILSNLGRTHRGFGEAWGEIAGGEGPVRQVWQQALTVWFLDVHEILRMI